jgi:hypothetical protein
LLKNSRFVSGYRFSDTVKAPESVSASAAARLLERRNEFFSKLLSRYGSGGQTSAAKAAVKIRGLLAASLKRCPDTNRFFPYCAIALNPQSARTNSGPLNI